MGAEQFDAVHKAIEHMDAVIWKHVRVLPLELVAASLAKELGAEPSSVSGYHYIDKEHGYIVHVEVHRA